LEAYVAAMSADWARKYGSFALFDVATRLGHTALKSFVYVVTRLYVSLDVATRRGQTVLESLVYVVERL